MSGIQSAGYKFVAWGATHRDAGGKAEPILAVDASPQTAKELGRQCRDLGLTPLLMFCGFLKSESLR